nr:unnamed protein product [Spirometra erinaceieuropaei]
MKIGSHVTSVLVSIQASQHEDPLIQSATGTLEKGHEFNFAGTRIMTQVGNETARELLAVRAFLNNSINRHVDIPSVVMLHARETKWRDPVPI